MGKRRSMMYKAILAIVALMGIVLLVNGAQDNAVAYVTLDETEVAELQNEFSADNDVTGYGLAWDMFVQKQCMRKCKNEQCYLRCGVNQKCYRKKLYDGLRKYDALKACAGR